MIIKCSNCGARYRIGDDLVAGGPKRFKCKSCGTVLLVKPPAAAKDPTREKPSGTMPPTTAKTPQPVPEQEQPVAREPEPSAGRNESTERPPASVTAQEQGHAAQKTGQTDENQQSDGAQAEGGALTPEEIAAQQQQNLQVKLEDRRRQMEDEISGRLNKAALETLDFDVLSELASQIQDVQHNPDFTMEKDAKLFSCIKCQTTFCLYPDDSRLCANCTDEVSLVRADDILKQFGMFG